MLRLTIGGLAALAIVGLAAPSPASAQGAACYWCDPIQGPTGHCARIYDGGMDDCEDVSGGGCDFRDADECPGGGPITQVSPDELILDGGKVIRGKWLNTGVFGVRSCTGEQRDVIYIASELDKRRQLARTIEMTVDDE